MAARQASATNNDAKIPENNKSYFFEGPASRGPLPLSIPQTRRRNHYYSLRSDFTGFAIAARIACQLTVTTVIANAPAPATAKIHHANPSL